MIQRMYEAEGRALRKLRTDRGVYQETVGDAVGVSKSAVSEWERGVSAPGRETLGRLDEYYGGRGAVLRIYGVSSQRPGRDLISVLSRLDELERLQSEMGTQLRELAAEQKQLWKLSHQHAGRRREEAKASGL